MKELKFEYYCSLWGGFFNDNNKKIHGFKEGAYYFDTIKERNDFIIELESFIPQLDSLATLARDLAEGFNVRKRAAAYRIIKYKGKFHYSEYKWSFANASASVIMYHMENKWYPGFNDYPLGENFDYSKVEIIEEGIKGYLINDKEV